MKDRFFKSTIITFLVLLVMVVVIKGLEKLVYLGDRELVQKEKVDKALGFLPSAQKSTQTASLAEVIVTAPEKPSKIILRPGDYTKDQKLVPSVLRRKLKGVKTGVIFDVTTKKVIWQKDMDKSVGIASMTKMMTCLMLLEKVEAGIIDLASKYKVTRTATLPKPSKVWLDVRENVDVESLGQALMIKSANDVAVFLAEIVTGSERVFVALMNAKAKILGLDGAKFYNPNGLTKGRLYNKATAMDMVKLSFLLLQYKDAVRWSSMKSADFKTDYRIKTNQIMKLTSHNKLLWRYPGVNGMKTGYTTVAGFCTTVTCTKDGKSVIIVLTGVKSSKERDAITLEALKWFYEQ